MNQDKIRSLLSSISKNPGQKSLNLRFNSKTLIVDGMNTFLRAFAMDNRLNHYGHHIGGISSFIKSIGYAIRNENPSRVIIVFDGEGGHINRRHIYPDYKKNRNTNNLVNKKAFDDKEEETQAKINEIERLIEYLNYLPVTLLSLDQMEADDVIGYISNYLYNENKDNQICIMSADRDFFQLINDRTFVYSPTKKKHYYINEVKEEFNCLPSNYLIYKCFLGDVSDNIKGVHGIGEKKIISLFPGMFDQNGLTFDKIYETCENPPGNSILYDRILNSKHILDINRQIMDLSNPFMNEDQSSYLLQELKERPQDLRKYDFLRLWHIDGMGNSISNVETWIDLFSVLNQ